MEDVENRYGLNSVINLMDKEKLLNNVYARLYTASTAKELIGKDYWAWDKTRLNFKVTAKKPKIPKCNLYVAEVIHHTTDQWPTPTGAPIAGDNSIWPFVAAQWADPHQYILNWEFMGDCEWLPGDIIAKKKTGEMSTGHCAIAVSYQDCVGAGEYYVTRGGHGLRNEGVVRRYKGHL